MPSDEQGGLLFVHAHPDDESIGTGATMAKYAAQGARVTLVTCTRGERGEIIPPGLRHLAADRDNRLGEHRIGELAAACAALGVTDYRFLGGPGRWRDSGMMGTPGNDDPACFWRADLDEAAAALVAVVREVRPRVMVSYDAHGGYGHPDHIQAHRVAWRAFHRAADPAFGEGAPWQVAKFYATALPRSVLAAAAAAMQADPPPAPFQLPSSIDAPRSGVPDEQVTTEIDASAFLPAKLAAMRAHVTQIAVAGEFFALADNVARRASGVEYYTLLAGPRGPGHGPHGRERDLLG